MTFLTRSLRYTLVATTALTLNTLIPAWAADDDDAPVGGLQRQDHTIGKQLEDARAEKKLDEWEGGIGGAFYDLYVSTEDPDPAAIPFNAILSMHITNTKQGMSRQDSAQKLFTYFLNMYRVTDECDNRIPNGLVDVWNDLDEASRKRHIKSIMFGDNTKDKLLLNLLIQSGGHGITITGSLANLVLLDLQVDKIFMDLVTKIDFIDLPFEPWDESLWKFRLRQFQPLYPHIHALKVSNVRLNDDDVIALAKALESHRYIRSLDLFNNDISDAGAAQLAGNTTLRELNLTDNYIGNAGAIALAGNTTLRKLRLDENRIGDAGAVALAGNTSLKELNLKDNNIGDRGALELGANRTLQKLNLTGYNISNSGAIALAANTTLRKLYLTGYNISDSGVIALAANTTLRKLYLIGGEILDSGVIALAANTTLRKLYLIGGVLDSGVIALAANTTLRVLNLAGNQIGNVGAIALAGNTTLRELNLADNRIGDAGAMEFLKLLVKNKSPLKKLDMGGNYEISGITKRLFKAWATANGVELLID